MSIRIKIRLLFYGQLNPAFGRFCRQHVKAYQSKVLGVHSPGVLAVLNEEYAALGSGFHCGGCRTP
jgi:hypothetical protein